MAGWLSGWLGGWREEYVKPSDDRVFPVPVIEQERSLVEAMHRVENKGRRG